VVLQSPAYSLFAMDRLKALYKKHVSNRFTEFSFIQWHYFYFIVTSLVSSIIFWGSSTPAKSVTYIDSLFLCVSAMTEAGLNTVNLSELNTWQQVMMFLLIIMGSAIFVSSSILHIRKKAFESKFSELIQRRRDRLSLVPRRLNFTLTRRSSTQLRDREAAIASGAVRGSAITPTTEKEATKSELDPSDRIGSSEDSANGENAAVNGHVTLPADEEKKDEDEPTHITFADQQPPTANNEARMRPLRHSASFFEGRGVGARRLQNHPRHARPVDFHEHPWDSAIDDEEPRGPWSSKIHKYVETVNGYLGRNSSFHNLSEKERRLLGGIEYDAIELLSWLVPAYFILFQLLGAIGVGVWIVVNEPNMTRENGQVNPFLVTAASNVTAASIHSGLVHSSPSVLSTTVAWPCSMQMLLL
jgi:hypothetical protein